MQSLSLHSLLGLALLACLGCEKQPSAARVDASESRPLADPIPAAAATATNETTSIPAGRFLMGDKDEVDAAPHEIAVSAFVMDKHLVTQEQFQRVMDSNPSRWKGDRNPVEQVRWSDAVRFCNKRSELE